MPLRIQSKFPKGPRFNVSVLGDSMSHSITLGVRPCDFWPTVLGKLMNAAGAAVQVANRAHSADTSTQGLARVSEVLLDNVPDLAIIFLGVNDPGSSIVAATTTANLRAIVQYLKNGCTGQVAVQTALPAGIPEGQRYLVTGDTDTTGGLNPANVTYPTVTGTAAYAVQVWESRNGKASVAGWSRVASYAAPVVSRFILCRPHFLQYSVSGDTVGADGTHTGQGATYNGVDVAVTNAATAEGVPTCDFFVGFQKRIIDGKDTATAFNWLVADSNQHWNNVGNAIAAGLVYTVVNAQGWVAALS